MNTPQERLEHFINQHFKKLKDFNAEMGISPSDVYKYIRNGSSVFSSPDKIAKLTKLGLNINWYFSGEGEMLTRKPGERVKNPNAEYGGELIYQTIPDLKGKTLDEIVKLKQDIKSKIEYLNNYMKQIDEEILKITDM